MEEELQDAENQVKYYETQLLMTRQEAQKLEEKNKDLTQKNSLLRMQVQLILLQISFNFQIFHLGIGYDC